MYGILVYRNSAITYETYNLRMLNPIEFKVGKPIHCLVENLKEALKRRQENIIYGLPTDTPFLARKVETQNSLFFLINVHNIFCRYATCCSRFNKLYQHRK